MSRYGAVLDACVLAPMPIADTLLRLAERGIFRPFWSEQILEETARTLRRMGYQDLHVEKRIATMRNQFPEALVPDISLISLTPSLPDPNDEHVLKTALRAGADAIVTENINDFPDAVCRPYLLDILKTDTFLINQLDLNESLVCDVLRDQSRAMRTPPVPLTQLLDELRKVAPEFVALVEIELAGGR